MADTPVIKSYRNRRRPTLDQAILAEGNVTLVDASIALTRKQYFTPHPRPWQLGTHNQGHGRGNIAVLDRFGDLVATTPHFEDATLIIAAVNSYRRNKKKVAKK